jgi:hypothetical protein
MPKPILQSLILADHVYEDKLTGKRIIAGIFNRIIRGVKVFRDMPAPMPPPQAPPSSQVQFSQPSSPATNLVTPEAPLIIQPGQGVPESAPAGGGGSVVPAVPASAPAPEVSGGEEDVRGTQPIAPPPAAAPASAPPAAAAAPAPSSPPPAEPAPAPPETPAPRQAPQQQTSFTPPPLQPGQRMLEIPPTGLQSGSPFAYMSLTEVRGVTPMVLQLVSLEDDTQLFRSDLRVECQNPLYTIELTVPLPPIAPPKAGIYALEVLYNHEILGSLRIVVEDAA